MDRKSFLGHRTSQKLPKKGLGCVFATCRHTLRKLANNENFMFLIPEPASGNFGCTVWVQILTQVLFFENFRLFWKKFVRILKNNQKCSFIFRFLKSTKFIHHIFWSFGWPESTFHGKFWKKWEYLWVYLWVSIGSIFGCQLINLCVFLGVS